MPSDLNYLKHNLSRVLKFTPDVGERIILAGVASGRYEYLVGRSSGEPMGFVVYSVRDTGKWLDMYLLCVWSSKVLGSDAFNLFMDKIKQLARAKGCKSMSFRSPRRGWLRKLAPHGFKEVPQITMRCTLEENDA